MERRWSGHGERREERYGARPREGVAARRREDEQREWHGSRETSYRRSPPQHHHRRDERERDMQSREHRSDELLGQRPQRRREMSLERPAAAATAASDAPPSKPRGGWKPVGQASSSSHSMEQRESSAQNSAYASAASSALSGHKSGAHTYHAGGMSRREGRSDDAALDRRDPPRRNRSPSPSPVRQPAQSQRREVATRGQEPASSRYSDLNNGRRDQYLRTSSTRVSPLAERQRDDHYASRGSYGERSDLDKRDRRARPSSYVSRSPSPTHRRASPSVSSRSNGRYRDRPPIGPDSDWAPQTRRHTDSYGNYERRDSSARYHEQRSYPDSYRDTYPKARPDREDYHRRSPSPPPYQRSAKKSRRSPDQYERSYGSYHRRDAVDYDRNRDMDRRAPRQSPFPSRHAAPRSRSGSVSRRRSRSPLPPQSEALLGNGRSKPSSLRSRRPGSPAASLASRASDGRPNEGLSPHPRKDPERLVSERTAESNALTATSSAESPALPHTQPNGHHASLGNLRAATPPPPPPPPQNPLGYSDATMARLAKSGVSEGTLLALQPSEGGFNRIAQVGEGTYGKVYKALVRASGVLVAMKRIRMESEKDGFPVTAMREIKLLQSLSHPNIVGLHEIMVGRGSVYMVFEYMDHDLTGVLSHPTFRFSIPEIKSLSFQLFEGLAYLHKNSIIHRDIKGSNILLNNLGELKLADFGLARLYEKRKEGNYTNRVITLWYRPPELLLGLTNYGPEVDNWSAGCIMLELFTRRPVFQGMQEIEQLEIIYRFLGTPTVEQWPGLVECPWFELVKPKTASRSSFEETFSKYVDDEAALSLISRLFIYNPKQRITASQVLEDRYFTQEPTMIKPQTLTELKGEWHELEAKHRKKRAKEIEARKGADASAVLPQGVVTSHPEAQPEPGVALS